MTASARRELRLKIVLSKGWTAPLSRGQSKYLRQKLAQERAAQFLRDQEKRLRDRYAQAHQKKAGAATTATPKGSAVAPLSPPVTTPSPVQPLPATASPRLLWTCRASVVDAYLGDHYTCYGRNPLTATFCIHCGAARPD
jgi:hypothetical protein